MGEGEPTGEPIRVVAANMKAQVGNHIFLFFHRQHPLQHPLFGEKPQKTLFNPMFKITQTNYYRCPKLIFHIFSKNEIKHEKSNNGLRNLYALATFSSRVCDTGSPKTCFPYPGSSSPTQACLGNAQDTFRDIYWHVWGRCIGDQHCVKA